MGNAESPEPRPAGIPRWLALALAPAVWVVGVPAVHAGLPWALSQLGPRYGWADGGPSGWNLLGYIPVAAGAALLVWIMVFGFSRYRDLPERVPIDWSPALLMTGGPYAFSRHPMYVGELALWLGWAVLYGSIPVLIGFAVLAALVGLLAPREERALEAKFGEVYRRYKARVPRWLGVGRRGGASAEPSAATDPARDVGSPDA
jgi:protein-S-isoprenylcysteine O-methyltransferase Ste14